MTLPALPRGLRRALLDWYDRYRRDLPWRETREPYAIWVSEVMLQQTRVERVVRYFSRFIERYPDPAALAAADEEEVLAAWSGLGYYRRAIALREGARVVVERHGGRLPSDPAALAALPGIGRYTAGAIASIAFDLCEPVLDGNVRRVLARLLAVDGARLGVAGESRALWAIAGRLADGARPGDLNQALMELGALVCLPRAPRCAHCPVARHCVAKAAGSPERWPARRPARSPEEVAVAVAFVVRGDRLLLERRAADNPLRGRWELPAVIVDRDEDDPRAALASALRARHGLELVPRELLARLRHGIMHRRLDLRVVRCRLREGGTRARPALRWVALDALDTAAVSGATRKACRAVSAARASAATAPPPARDRAPTAAGRGAAARRGTTRPLRRRAPTPR